MTDKFRTVSRVMRHLWPSVSSSDPGSRQPENAVIVHDPDASRPHDLDDPFFDRRVQSRMADVIAGIMRRTAPEG